MSLINNKNNKKPRWLPCGIPDDKTGKNEISDCGQGHTVVYGLSVKSIYLSGKKTIEIS